MTRFDRMLISAFAAMLLLLAPAICQTTRAAAPKTAAAETSRPKYIFLFIGDGMGLAHRRLAEFVESDGDKKLLMNDLPVKCLTATHSANAKVTDSAASGTAMACGAKTNNGMLGQTPDGKELTSIAKKAETAGMRVGILTSVTLNHATPAAFYANVKSRNMYDDISEQLVKSNFDFFAAGGFATSKKKPEEVVTIWEKAGYKVHVGRPDKLNPENKNIVIGKIGNAPLEKVYKNIVHSYQAAWNRQMYLEVLTQHAIRLLDNPRGFFIMVEGGQIDWAAHANQGYETAYETLGLNRAVKVAYDFYKKHPAETLIVVTADHETGGLTLDESKIKMKELRSVHHANPELKEIIMEMKEDPDEGMILGTKRDPNADIMDAIIKASGDILTDKEKAELKKRWAKTLKDPKKEYVSNYLKNIAQSRSGVTFSTGGHTGAKVQTTAVGCGAALFKNAKDNTDIAKLIMQMLPAKK